MTLACHPPRYKRNLWIEIPLEVHKEKILTEKYEVSLEHITVKKSEIAEDKKKALEVAKKTLTECPNCLRKFLKPQPHFFCFDGRIHLAPHESCWNMRNHAYFHRFSDIWKALFSDFSKEGKSFENTFYIVVDLQIFALTNDASYLKKDEILTIFNRCLEHHTYNIVARLVSYLPLINQTEWDKPYFCLLAKRILEVANSVLMLLESPNEPKNEPIMKYIRTCHQTSTLLQILSNSENPN